MTKYEARDRQGVKYFKRKPSFMPGHDVFTGARCAAPTKKDRVVRRFKAMVAKRGMRLDEFYPDVIDVRPRQ